MDYPFPQYDRHIFSDRMVEQRDVKMALERLFDDATEHYKTNTYVIESINIVNDPKHGWLDIYMTTRR